MKICLKMGKKQTQKVPYKSLKFYRVLFERQKRPINLYIYIFQRFLKWPRKDFLKV